MLSTYLIKYSGIDDYNSIEFCASSRDEAIELFNQWCIIDNKMSEPVPLDSIEIVYNRYDKLEYGKIYLPQGK